MSDTRSASRTAQSPQERQWRSRLRRLLNEQAFVRGSLSVRQQVCGKPNCRCVKGRKHRAVYLVVSHEGKYRQMYVSREMEASVRQWVENYRELRDLMERVSQVYQDKLRQRHGTSPSSAASSDTGRRSSGSKA